MDGDLISVVNKLQESKFLDNYQIQKKNNMDHYFFLDSFLFLWIDSFLSEKVDGASYYI